MLVYYQGSCDACILPGKWLVNNTILMLDCCYATALGKPIDIVMEIAKPPSIKRGLM